MHWKSENIPFFSGLPCAFIHGEEIVKVIHLDYWLGIAKNAVSSSSFLFWICLVCAYVHVYVHAHIGHFLLVLPGTSHFHLCSVLVTLQTTKSFSAGIYLNCECLLQVNYEELKAETWLLTSAGSRSLSHVIEIQNGQVELQFLCVDLTWNDPQVITFPL